jgi:hypothetical protein
VIVPDDDLWDLRVEGPHVLVEEVVLVVAPIVVNCLRHLRLRLGDHVGPDRSVVELDLRLQHAVGVNRVATVNEHVGLYAAHGVVEAQPAPRGIDAPPLADGVGGPRQRDVATRG